MRSLILACTAAVLLASGCLAQRRPPNYSQDNMPETSFDCGDKDIGGYYADPEADCQMFHVCVKMGPAEATQDFRFLCPNDTMFDQENQICANWFDIDCEASTLYYSKSFDLFRVGRGPAPDDVLQRAPVSDKFLSVKPVKPAKRPQPPKPAEDEFFRTASSSDIHRGRDEEDEAPPAPAPKPSPKPGQRLVRRKQHRRLRPQQAPVEPQNNVNQQQPQQPIQKRVEAVTPRLDVSQSPRKDLQPPVEAPSAVTESATVTNTFTPEETVNPASTISPTTYAAFQARKNAQRKTSASPGKKINTANRTPLRPENQFIAVSTTPATTGLPEERPQQPINNQQRRTQQNNFNNQQRPQPAQNFNQQQPANFNNQQRQTTQQPANNFNNQQRQTTQQPANNFNNQQRQSQPAQNFNQQPINNNNQQRQPQQSAQNVNQLQQEPANFNNNQQRKPVQLPINNFNQQQSSNFNDNNQRQPQKNFNQQQQPSNVQRAPQQPNNFNQQQPNNFNNQPRQPQQAVAQQPNSFNNQEPQQAVSQQPNNFSNQQRQPQQAVSQQPNNFNNQQRQPQAANFNNQQSSNFNNQQRQTQPPSNFNNQQNNFNNQQRQPQQNSFNNQPRQPQKPINVQQPPVNQQFNDFQKINNKQSSQAPQQNNFNNFQKVPVNEQKVNQQRPVANNNQQQFQPFNNFNNQQQTSPSTFNPSSSFNPSSNAVSQTPSATLYSPVTFNPRQRQSVSPKPFQVRRPQRPRENDFSEEKEDELLRTAHSSSFRASDLNAIHRAQQSSPRPQQPTFGVTNAPTKPPVSLSSPKPFSRASSAASSAQTTPRVFSSSTFAPQFSSSRQSVSSTLRPVTETIPAFGSSSTLKPAHSKANANSDYDYAYYDDTPFDQYEGVEQINEFAKTKQG